MTDPMRTIFGFCSVPHFYLQTGNSPFNMKVLGNDKNKIKTNVLLPNAKY